MTKIHKAFYLKTGNFPKIFESYFWKKVSLHNDKDSHLFEPQSIKFIICITLYNDF